MKKKTIATSVLAIAMSASLAVGGTYALFTSESKVNVAITSGKVEVVATVANLQAYSGSWNTTTSEYDSVVSTTEYTGTNAAGYYFANGGFAGVSTTANTVTLDRITPMDKVTFDVVLTNNSNVAIQYRTVIKVVEDDGLFSGLEVKIGTDAQVYGGTTTYSHWTSFDGVTKTVPVSIELPQGAGNEYQNKSCTISYTVEAVQGNAYVFDGEAWLIQGETRTEMSTLSDALTAAHQGDTIKMAHAGTYAPFTVATEGVTVEGIIGETKADSTVFVTTADQNVQLYANGVTVKNAWFEISEEQTEATMPGFTHRGAIDMLVHAGSGTVANNITLDGCYFNGNNLADRAFIYCGNKLTVKNCTFEKFNYCAFDSMDDNNTPEKIEIVGNTFKGLNIAYDIYAGAPYTGSEKNLVIKNNVSDNGAIVRIWDYAQYVRPTEGSAFNAEVTGNTNISLYLTHFDNHFVTPIVTDETDIVYHMEVAFPAAVTGTYSVLNADGSEITTFGDHKTTRVHNGVIVYALRAGDYMLKNADHTYLFTVTSHTAGVVGSGYTAANVRKVLADGFCYNLSEGVYEVSSAAGLRAFAASVNGGNSYAGKTVKLMESVDLAGSVWTPIGQTGATQFQGTFDGQGKTISNMTVDYNETIGSYTGTTTNYACGLFGWVELHAGNPIVIKNIKFENANVIGIKYTGVVAGYVNGAAGANIENCEVKNSTVISDSKNAGGIVGYSGRGTVVNNTVSGCEISAKFDVGGIANAVEPAVTFTGNKVENTNIYYEEVKDYDAAGIFTSGKVVYRDDNTKTTFVPDSTNVATGVTIVRQLSVSTAEQLSAALNATYSVDTTILLTSDINLAGVAWGAHILQGTNNNTALTIDGNGKTISGLTSDEYTNVNGFNSNGLVTCIMSSLSSVTFKNLTVSGANLTNDGGWNAASGVFVGDINTVKVTFDTCTVTGATVTSDAYAAGFVGYVQDVYATSPTLNCPLTLKNCTVTNSTFNGNDATGALVGLNNATATINGATVTGNTINGGAGYSAAALVGTAQNNVTATNVTVSGNTYTRNEDNTNSNIVSVVYGYIFKASGKTYSVNGTEVVNS